MLSKVFEWSRMAHPTMDDDFVTKRSAVVKGLIDQYAKDVTFLVESASFAVGGFTARFTQETPFVAKMVDAVRAQQPATAQAIAENNVDIRSTAALFVGELADRAAKSGSKKFSDEIHLMVALVVASLGHKPLPQQKFVKTVLTELLEVCQAAMSQAADYRRLRYALSNVEQIAEAADVPTFWKDAKPKLAQLALNIEANSAIDREELDTLWWAFNGVLQKTSLPISSYPVGVAALRSAVDLVGVSLEPPLPNTRFLLNRALASDRPLADLAARPLKDFIGEWDATTAADLAPTDSATSKYVNANPAVLPLSWICQRIVDSSGQPVADVKKLTGWDPATKIAPATLASQVFDERVAQIYCENKLPV